MVDLTSTLPTGTLRDSIDGGKLIPEPFSFRKVIGDVEPFLKNTR